MALLLGVEVLVPPPAMPGRTRPLCAYPAYARYVAGNVNAAGSFTCTAP